MSRLPFGILYLLLGAPCCSAKTMAIWTAPVAAQSSGGPGMATLHQSMSISMTARHMCICDLRWYDGGCGQRPPHHPVRFVFHRLSVLLLGRPADHKHHGLDRKRNLVRLTGLASAPPHPAAAASSPNWPSRVPPAPTTKST